MKHPHADTTNNHGSAGRKAGRAFARMTPLLLHAAAALALTAGGVWLCRGPGIGMIDRMPYDAEGVGGAYRLAGALDRPLGQITSETRMWTLRGIGGDLGVLLVGNTERTGPVNADEAALLRAAERLADSSPGMRRSIYTRAWASNGPVLLFEPAGGAWLPVTATLLAGSAAWYALFTLGRALITGRVRRARAAAGQCTACGYPLGGLAERPCPECGKVP